MSFYAARRRICRRLSCPETVRSAHKGGVGCPRCPAPRVGGPVVSMVKLHFLRYSAWLAEPVTGLSWPRRDWGTRSSMLVATIPSLDIGYCSTISLRLVVRYHRTV